MAATLYLEDGTEVTGKLFGANKNVAGEVGKNSPFMLHTVTSN